jgi:cell division protein FtsZ
LISITGGNDLTLYEVDEAASRIRQEVDDEANIILGATFDETLEGVVRVSVVATGIDQPAEMRDPALSESRIAEAAQRLRAQAASRHAEQAAIVPAIETVAEPVRPAAPVYAAAQPGHLSEVHIEPAPPRPHYEPAPAPRAQEYAPQPGPFIPPAAEQPIRAPRMPQIEDLPLPVQQQIRAQRGEAPPENATETRRRTLLERLAAFGMSRQEDAHHAPAPQLPALPAPPRLAAPAPARPAPAPVHTEYARRPAAPAPAPAPRQVQLDPHGRATPVARSAEDDHLEIPAFLRRQSS